LFLDISAHFSRLTLDGAKENATLCKVVFR